MDLSSGYAFALPRLAARLAGRAVRQARLSRCETYSIGIFVFALSCAAAGRLLLPFVRPLVARALLLLALPFALWVAWLLLFYLLALLLRSLRRAGICRQMSSHDFQHILIITLVTVLAVMLARDENGWLRSLGWLWLALLFLNLLSLIALHFLDET